MPFVHKRYTTMDNDLFSSKRLRVVSRTEAFVLFALYFMMIYFTNYMLCFPIISTPDLIFFGYLSENDKCCGGFKQCCSTICVCFELGICSYAHNVVLLYVSVLNLVFVLLFIYFKPQDVYF